MKVQRLSVSTFCYATEDEEKIRKALADLLGETYQGVEFHKEELSGHYGDPIIALRVELGGERATNATKAIIKRMEVADLIFMISTMPNRVEGSKIYLRIDKQALLSSNRVFLKDGEDVVKLIISIKGSKERFMEELKEIVSRNMSAK
ncbi:MAG: RNA-binding domain-containing protein [Metallosphaera yellowstonensis]|jgi:Predicted exosome subunit|uniref:Putative exosome subunit n=1 Tax=Metallosphaera yellowstonensis MK1 TaxID=671065 RepID=H2C6M2_9CREN|nr:RNA-binding domain-containing protein [Metallosphaera yellowstonensis]EHP69449.1 putative exosome subunit [Metallosphaera yellowstonensis MK1]